MTTIKKGYLPIYNILIENEDKNVSEIMDLLIPIMVSQQRDKNHFDDEHGLWIFCYYHKEWELTAQVEYGKKTNTATGLNSMCKVGTNQWTKQQRDFKKAKADLLDEVGSGSLEVINLQSRIEELEDDKNLIKTLTEHHEEDAYKDPRQQTIEE